MFIYIDKEGKKWDIELTSTYREYRDIRCRDNESGLYLHIFLH